MFISVILFVQIDKARARPYLFVVCYLVMEVKDLIQDWSSPVWFTPAMRTPNEGDILVVEMAYIRNNEDYLKIARFIDGKYVIDYSRVIDPRDISRWAMLNKMLIRTVTQDSL